MAIFVFVPADFKTVYPEFAAVADARLNFFFLEAEAILDNTDCSPVQNVVRRGLLLYMLVAHIGFLEGVLNPGGATTPVGRIKKAQEGTVEAEMDYVAPASYQWFIQSQYGAMFWQCTLSLRSFHYSPPVCRGWNVYPFLVF